MVLTIRAEQLKVFEEAAQQRFVIRAAEYLERRYPDRCRQLGRDAVLASVRVALAKGEAYRLVSELDIIHYLNLMYGLGFEFEEHEKWAWVRDILASPVLDSEEKMTRVLGGMSHV